MIVVSVLTGMAAPELQAVVDRARVVRATADIHAIEVDIASYQAAHDSLPASLGAIGRATMTDPWGRHYQYWPGRHDGGGVRVDGARRPLNSDYDLYSDGADGTSSSSIAARISRDDVIRAGDGEFIGEARNWR